MKHPRGYMRSIVLPQGYDMRYAPLATVKQLSSGSHVPLISYNLLLFGTTCIMHHALIEDAYWGRPRLHVRCCCDVCHVALQSAPWVLDPS